MNFVQKKLTTIYNTHQPHIVLLRPPKDLCTCGGRGGEAVPAYSEAFILCVVQISYHLLMLFSIVIQERAHSSSERVLRDDDVIHTSLTLMSDLLALPSNFLLSWLLARKKPLLQSQNAEHQTPVPFFTLERSHSEISSQNYNNLYSNFPFVSQWVKP